LGSAPHTRYVCAYTWDSLPSDLTVHDYDVAILDFASWCEEGGDQQVTVKNLPDKQQFLELLFSKGSEIIVVGIPGAALSSNAKNTWWLPCVIHIREESGETITVTKEEFQYYFQHVRSWSFYAMEAVVPEGWYSKVALSLICPGGRDVRVRTTSIAETRFQKPISFTLHFFAYPTASSSAGSLLGTGTVIWLPPPTEISPYEAINLVLRKRYGLRFETEPPNWVQKYKLPSQLPIEDEINDLHQEITEKRRRLEDATMKLQTATRFRELLYEQGESLENVAKDCLRELGAKVEDPKRKGHEDGRLIDPTGRRGMLEIKGRTGSIKLTDVRQLDQWARDAIAQEDYDSKGFLISNAYCTKEPSKRSSPFPDDCIRSSKQFGLCLLTTSQLFQAICLKQRGELNVQSFWDSVFSTDGLCDLPELDKE